MYGATKHLLFSCLVLISLASCLEAGCCQTSCDVIKRISRLENECGDRIKSLLKYRCPEALFFSGGINEYAIINERDGTTAGLDAITSCFWVNTTKTTNLPTMLSYAIPNQDNEFIIHIEKSKIVVVFKVKTGRSTGGFFRPGFGVSDGQWHHVCITWKSSDGVVEAYKDGNLEKEKTGVITGQRIGGRSGAWIIGQDQDSVGGDFEKGNAFRGSLTDVNVWDRVLDSREISILAKERCGFGVQGNHRAYGDFEPKGPVRKFKPSCCQ